MRRTILGGLFLVMLLAAQFANVSGASAATIYSDLDDDANAWGMFLDPVGRAAGWEINGVSAPSLDGQALGIVLDGGDAYTGLHAYRSLPAAPSARTFTMSMRFRYDSSPNQMQALEFSLSKWQNNKRWEWAMQWQNIQDGTAEQGQPQSWRLWDGRGWKNIGVSQQLAPNRWHTFTLVGEVDNRGQVKYTRMVVNGVTTKMSQTFAPMVGEYEAVTVAVQVDGDEAMNRQQVYLEDVSVEAR